MSERERERESCCETVRVIKNERERGRERQRQRDRQRETERKRQRDRERQRERQRETERETESGWVGKDEYVVCVASMLKLHTQSKERIIDR
jgi:hypothetical protein